MVDEMLKKIEQEEKIIKVVYQNPITRRMRALYKNYKKRFKTWYYCEFCARIENIKRLTMMFLFGWLLPKKKEDFTYMYNENCELVNVEEMKRKN